MKAQIKELGDIITGNTPSKQEQSYWNSEDICFVKPDMIGEYGIEQINDSKEHISENARKKARIVDTGAILVTCIGTIGKVGIAAKECAFNQQINAIVPNQRITPKYLAYCLLYNKKRLAEIANAPVVPIINKTQFGEFVVAVEEKKDKQAEIVETLDAANAVIEMRKQELQKMDDLIKARFVEVFGDFDLTLQKPEWTPISQVGTVVGGSTPKTSVSEYWDGEYRWISPAELKADSGIIYDSVKKITKAGVDSCSLQELPVGTVILSSRAPIGKLAIAGNTFYCNQGFKNIICNEKVLPRYLYTLLLFNTDYLNSLGRGATFKEISKSIVENIRIPLPSNDKQKQFETFVNQIDKSKVAVQQALDKAQLLFDSLMQKHFARD